ncbi:bifunctional protein-serine/threonine kinase/phosphatase [Billgrantia montanilacus]|uniref:Bifunctional protein-serine/threonine kinase/phosphatase n=1 Tax=Billgrantia montanilacus TaxID=2282305 RepID=A0A368TNS3_9GAMM|nr:bifunctional protein-serine/threonine kinase/phosphatase [Halomonas montanilacus]RCV86261.1 bifunctional protein-serine/threonine kinase/phosphatase [Halomonas montanilacus]
MASQLSVSLGQYSTKGRKEINQDFHGAFIPDEPQLTSKGIAIALADGISSSDVSQVASEAAVTGFFEDYYCTSETWSVKKSAQRVLMATNSWLHAQTRQSQYRYDKDRGYVCTLSAMVIKSATAHVFHVGDARIYRLSGNSLELLTNDHRFWISREKSYLSRAMGVSDQLEIDYQAVSLEKGDTFFLLTDGVYEFVKHDFMVSAVQAQGKDLGDVARRIVNEAFEKGSTDNLTVQIVRIENLPVKSDDELYQTLAELPFPPALAPRMLFDGYRIVRKLHASSRSHVYLAENLDDNTPVVIKTLSTELQQDTAHLERFLTEEWVARRINSAHVAKPCLPSTRRHFLYTVMEFIDGQTLTQWMIDNPKPDLETVRGIIEQIAKGLRAFHRLEMLHQDLRPDNIMIDSMGTARIIDFGSARVAGIVETVAFDRGQLLGTAQYTAPEYFLGESGTPRSDMFSLGVIAYQMLTGKLPYGTRVAKSRTRAAQNRLVYQPALSENRDLPPWIDDVLKKVLHPHPYKRYDALSEFVFELRHPNKQFLNKARPPLMERDPVRFWQGVSLALFIIVAMMLFGRLG